MQVFAAYVLYMSDMGLLLTWMNNDSHCGCIRRQCHCQRLGKLPGESLESQLERVKIFFFARLAEVPTDCLRFGQNQTFFFLLTLLRDPMWHYRINQLHPKRRPIEIPRGCSLCEWEPMEMTLNELVDYLIDVGPYEEPPTPDFEDTTPPLSLAEDTEESEDEREPRVEEYREDSEDEGESEEDPEEDHIEEVEPIEEYPEEDPEEDPDEDLEQEPKGDSEINEGQMMSGEDLEGDQGEAERNHPAQDEQASSSREVEQRINSLWGRAEREVGMNHCRRGNCG